VPELLRIIARMNVGGPARHAIRVSAPLAARGWHTTLVTGRADAGEGELLEEAHDAGIETLVLPGLGRAIRPHRDLSVLRGLRRLLAERRPALVHTHTAKAGALGRLAALTCRGRRPALVHTFHGHVLSGYFGRVGSAVFTATERALARRTDCLIAVAPAVRDELLQRHRVGAAKQYAIVPPGFDRERTAPDSLAGARLREELGLPPDAVLVGYLGRLAAIKQVDRLLDAWDIARARVPGLHLLVMGDGPLGESLRARIALLPGAHWRPPASNLSAAYGALDLLALPSAAEGCPQVVVEALAAGVPVLASAVGGVPGLLQDGVNGQTVPPDGVTPLAEALERLASDRAWRATLAAGAAATDLAEHAAEVVAERLADLYEQLTDSRLETAPEQRHTAAQCISSS
jgi:glycosyltransferase involved in cell wall biosynthesis